MGAPLNSSLATSWRDVPVHPAADLFPMLLPDELRELGEDIKKNGLQSPITLWTDGDRRDRNATTYLLDGRNRLDALEAAGVCIVASGEIAWWAVDGGEEMTGTRPSQASRFVYENAVTVHLYRGDGDDPYAHAVSLNLKRRHLTAQDKRDVIAKLLKATPNKSNRQIAETVKASHVTVGAVRAELEGRGQIDHVERHTDTKGRQQPARKPRTEEPPITKGADPAVTAAVERAVARSEENQRRQAAGTGIDPAVIRAQFIELMRSLPKPKRIDEIETLIGEVGLSMPDFIVTTKIRTWARRPPVGPS